MAAKEKTDKLSPQTSRPTSDEGKNADLFFLSVLSIFCNRKPVLLHAITFKYFSKDPLRRMCHRRKPAKHKLTQTSMNRITDTQIQREMGDSDHGTNFHVRGPDGGAAAAPGCQTGHMARHEVPFSSPGGVTALRGLCHLVGASVHEKQESSHGSTASHDGLQCVPGGLLRVDVLGGKYKKEYR